jgi:flagellar FliL protein
MAAKQETKAPEAAAGDAPPAPTGLKAKLPLIAILAVGLAVGGGTGAAFVGPMVAKKMGKVVVAPVHADSAAKEGDAAAGEGEAAPKEGEKGKEGEGAADAMHVLENLVLNPAGSGGSRFLLLTVAIEAGTPKAGEEFKTRDAELRDIILTSLGSKTVDELVDMSTREKIKTEVSVAIAKRFGKTSVKRLYFPQFVVQ